MTGFTLHYVEIKKLRIIIQKDIDTIM